MPYLTESEHAELASAVHELKAEILLLRKNIEAERAAAHERERKLSAALGSEREHSEWLQGECNKAVDNQEWANGKKAKATALVAQLQRDLAAARAVADAALAMRVTASAQAGELAPPSRSQETV